MIRAEADRRIALVGRPGDVNQPVERHARLGFGAGGGCSHSLQPGYEVRDRLRFWHRLGVGLGADGLDQRVVGRHQWQGRLAGRAIGNVALQLSADIGRQLPQEEARNYNPTVVLLDDGNLVKKAA